MQLSDNTINEKLDSGDIVITPLDRNNIQPASVDLLLSPAIDVYYNFELPYVDLRNVDPEMTKRIHMLEDEPFILHPGEFVLASTNEWIEIPDYIAARLEGKSSLARLGLVIHSTAGYVDPGWKGNLTMELSNHLRLPITLYPKMKICQITFTYTTTPVDRPYGSDGLGSRYQYQYGPVASRYTTE